MRALVVYDSPRGATREVAEVVADGARADVLDVREAPPLATLDVDLLLVGAPAAVMGALPVPRRGGTGRGGTGAATDGGMRAWLDAAAPPGLRVAAFSTHVRHRAGGPLAGPAIQRRLRRLGCHVVAPAATFAERPGADVPPADRDRGAVPVAELSRARDWGGRVGRLAAARLGV